MVAGCRRRRSSLPGGGRGGFWGGGGKGSGCVWIVVVFFRRRSKYVMNVRFTGAGVPCGSWLGITAIWVLWYVKDVS